MEKLFKEKEKEIHLLIFGIKKKDILYFVDKGNIQYSSSVHGGEIKTTGGGVNLGGAAIGGALFGSAGAMIGSRLGENIRVTSEGVHTTTEKHDNRYVELFYKSKDALKKIELPYYFYDVLVKVIPEKHMIMCSFKITKQINHN